MHAERGQRLAELILAASRYAAGLGPGPRLPTERQLAEDLGVTRSSVRHALAMLEATATSPAKWAGAPSCATWGRSAAHPPRRRTPSRLEPHRPRSRAQADSRRPT